MSQRAKPLYRDAVIKATDQMMVDFEKLGIVIPDSKLTRKADFAKALVTSILRTYLEASEPHKRAKREYSQTTKLMADMEIGQTIALPLQPLQSARSRIKSARDLMGNQEAAWSMAVGEDKILCTRRPDGETGRAHDYLSNPKVKELVGIPVGKTIFSTALGSTRGKGQMGSNTKIAARKYLKDPQADWRVASIDGRVVVKRIK